MKPARVQVHGAFAPKIAALDDQAHQQQYFPLRLEEQVPIATLGVRVHTDSSDCGGTHLLRSVCLAWSSQAQHVGCALWTSENHYLKYSIHKSYKNCR
jgi:hypothetical protein